MKGLLLFLIIIGFEIFRLIRYHRTHRNRVFSAVRTLQHGQSSNPTYEACKIIGDFIITEDYSKGLFFYLITPYYEDILAVFPPSLPDCVPALRWSPEGTQFLGFAAFIIHVLGIETGGAFIHQEITTLGVSSLQKHDIEKLLKCIQEQLKVRSRAHDNCVQLLPEELFGSVESEIVIETSGFGEVNFEKRWKNARISGAGTLGRFRVRTFYSDI